VGLVASRHLCAVGLVYPVAFTRDSPCNSALKHPGICRAYGGEHWFCRRSVWQRAEVQEGEDQASEETVIDNKVIVAGSKKKGRILPEHTAVKN